MNRQGHVFWLFGLSGAGKTCLAARLQQELVASVSTNPLMLDGDRLRSGLCRGLGYTDADRDENLRRAAEVARLGVESGVIVVAAFITPREHQRRVVETIVGRSHLSLVYLSAGLDVCRGRDVKGLYARAAAGYITGMSGVDYPFDAPLLVDLRLDTARVGETDCAAALCDFARRRLRVDGCCRTE